MALDLGSIHPLSDFQRNTKDYIRKLKKSGKPAVLTVNGAAEIVVQSAEAYQKLLDEQELLESLRRITLGVEQAKRREGIDLRRFLNALASEHGMSLK
jgi:prevent-host-death family protein